MLLAPREEQGGFAGLIWATTGLTFVAAPTTAHDGLWALLPIIAGAVIMAIITVSVFVHPGFCPDHRRTRSSWPPAVSE